MTKMEHNNLFNERRIKRILSQDWLPLLDIGFTRTSKYSLFSVEIQYPIHVLVQILNTNSKYKYTCTSRENILCLNLLITL